MQHMMRWLAMFFWAVLLISWPQSGAAYQVVADKDYPPLVFFDDGVEPTGYDVDLLRALERKTRLPMQLETLDWKEAKAKVMRREADILLGAVRTPEREAVLDFSEPYLETKTVIFTRRDDFAIRDIPGLINRRVAVQQGSVADEYLHQQAPQLQPYRFGTQQQGMQALVNGEVDAVVGNYFIGMYLVTRNDWQERIKSVSTPLTVNQYCIAVPKGRSELLLPINQALREMEESGELAALQDKWFGENYFISAGSQKRLKQAFLWVIGMASVVFALALVFIYSLRRQVEVATAQLREANRQLQEGYEVTIRAFFKAIEQRESETARHSLAVNAIAMEIGKEMGLSAQEMLDLNWGSLLHDIGKLSIPDDILLKKGALNDLEYAAIQRHPEIGFEILNEAAYLRQAAQVALQHQERYDGGGYPGRLQGEAISLLARICTVADAFEAMVADRPYRQGRPWQEAVREIERCRGTQFDPQVVDAFLRLHHEKLAAYSKPGTPIALPDMFAYLEQPVRRAN